jgi:5-formyltetrahydrofolate cyclo-ligase
MPREEDEDRETFSSPACSMHEFADDLVPPSALERDLPPPPTSADAAEPGWPAVKAWRAQMRPALIGRRTALEIKDRQQRGARAKERLCAEIDLKPYRVLGIYWPIRAEIDVRDIAERHIEAGGVAALPVVVHKNAPVEFWPWEPGTSMRRGFWNIPVPQSGTAVRPDALIIPLVGFDSACFRLGYGGGYYDRTLAALSPRPLRIGLAYAEAQIATIYPQPHDVPMSVIVTDRALHRAAASK